MYVYFKQNYKYVIVYAYTKFKGWNSLAFITLYYCQEKLPGIGGSGSHNNMVAVKLLWTLYYVFETHAYSAEGIYQLCIKYYIKW